VRGMAGMTDASATRRFGIVLSRQCWPAAAIGSRGGPIVAVPQDLALWLPLIAVAAAWLWQRSPWGYLLIGATLVFGVLENTAVAVDQCSVMRPTRPRRRRPRRAHCSSGRSRSSG
jgi:hypothetical protein